MKVPIVAIIGRANVGKSSLFNAIIGRREAIVANEPGTTRDPVTAKTNYREKDFWLIDTAGLKKADDSFELSIQEQILEAASSAEVLMVVIESGTIFTEEDRAVAKLALKSGKKVVLVVNKAEKTDESEQDYRRLGILDIFYISCTQRIGIWELVKHITDHLPKTNFDQLQNKLTIGLIGRPNVGKSSLFNSLAQKQQAIVSSKAGTTRDINRLQIKYKGADVEILDTAGLRKKSKTEKGIEEFSMIRSLKAIEESDVCFLLTEIGEMGVRFDQHLAGVIKEAGKGLVLVVSKWDIAEKDEFTHDTLVGKLRYQFDFVPFAPVIFTSSITGQNVNKLLEIAQQIQAERVKKIPTKKLNAWLVETVASHAPAGLKNQHPKLKYIIQENETLPPTFQIHGSNNRMLHWSYRRYLERSLRQKFGFEGVPLMFYIFDDRKEAKKQEINSEKSAKKQNL